MKERLRLITVLMLIVALLIGTVGCSSSPSEAPDGNGETQGQEESSNGESGAVIEDLVFAMKADIVSLDPADHLQIFTSFVTESIYDTLFIPDPDGSPVPQIADTYDFVSDTELQIKIHEGIKFHDGSEMKAEDVAASLMRAKESKKVGKYYVQIDTIDIIDDYTVKINLTEAYVPIVIALSHHSAAILPKAYIDSEPDFSQPIGSGAYKFVSWTSGESVVLEKNDEYFDTDNISPFETVTLRVIPEGTSLTSALEAGEVHIVENLDTIDFERVNDTSGLQGYMKDSNYTNYLFFNLDKEPYNSLAFRKAFNYAVNKESVNIVANNGYATIMHNVTPKHFLGYNEDVRYDFDQERAKELFAEAGVTSDDVFKLSVFDDVSKRVGEVIQGNMLDLGLNMEIEIVEWGKFVGDTSSGDFEIAILGWGQSSDPDRYFSQLLHSSAIDGQNRARYSNPEMDALIDAGRAESDIEKREEIYQKAYRLAMEDAPWVPLYVSSSVYGATDNMNLDKAVSSEGSFYFNFIEMK
jgi:peptide/nickel transport system substrate-binding protein